MHELAKPEPVEPVPIEVEPELTSPAKRRRKGKGKARAATPQSEMDEEDVDELESPPDRIKRRRRTSPEVVVKDEEQDTAAIFAAAGPSNPIALDDDDEKQLKPRLKVSCAPSPAYAPADRTDAGFSIFGRTLVVVVEPYPPLRETPAPEPTAPQEIRELSVLPTDRARSSSAMPAPGRAASRRRSETPLFRAETPGSVEPELDARGLPPDAFRHLRASSQSLAHDPWDVDDEDADLPPDDPFAHRREASATPAPPDSPL